MYKFLLPLLQGRSRSGRVLRQATAAVDLSEEDSGEWHEATDSDSGFEGGGRRRMYPSAYDSGMLGACRGRLCALMMARNPGN